jgi:glc operon protein GlcG
VDQLASTSAHQKKMKHVSKNYMHMDKLISKKTLSLQVAKKLIEYAIHKAHELKVDGAIAVVDDGGHLICLERIDGTMAAAANIAIGKAATAAVFNRSGDVLENAVTNDRPVMALLNSVSPFPYVPLKGSYPIEIDNQMVGAVAVAGAKNGENDEKIVLYAIDQLKALL